jgi:cysteine desulfurase/selenocysteine lyase
MNTHTLIRRDLRADFPGLRTADGQPWHYLDSGATAQKPQAVIDATVRAMGADYATVHRGVYARSADMTLAYEAARRRVAEFIGGAADEVVFTRGATEAINLVAQSWGVAQLKAGDRVLLSTLEHHSNIVPWQLLRDRIGIEIDVCPLTDDGQIDLDAAERMLTPAHRLVAFAHVSNVLGSVLDATRAAALAHGVGAKLLLDGCQAVPRLTLDVAALDCDFYVFSAHKLYGPTGIGALWARAEILESMPPWQGQDHLCAAAAAFRGGDTGHHRGHRPCCRNRLCRCHRADRDPLPRGGAGAAIARRTGAEQPHHPVRPGRVGGHCEFRVGRGASA